MKRILSVAVGVLVVALSLPLVAQVPIASLPQLRAGISRVTPLAKTSPLTPLGTRTSTGFATIQGNATRSGGSLPNSMVRLRDARFGRIIDTQVTDRTGVFAFRGLDPGNYIVEIVSNNAQQSVLSATQMISANAGETVTAVVRMPIQPSMFAGVLGQQGATSASASPAGLAEVVPTIVEQLPQAAVQSIPAVVPVAPPVSER